jgi:hypothetical protein
MPTLHGALAMPVMIAHARDHTARRFLEFFAASIGDDNARIAYYRAVSSPAPPSPEEGDQTTPRAGWRGD